MGRGHWVWGLMGMVTSNGHGVSFVGDEKVLEVDSDEAYTTL